MRLEISKRKQHAPDFKENVTLEASKGEETIPELLSRFDVHPAMIHQWKRALMEGVSKVFERDGERMPELLYPDHGSQYTSFV
ncbi:transposase [Roseibium sp. MMSF_3544]|uniref:transposase n=1 Tax=unclassified Roseibium TaxID=2629323 RepID=UPI00353237DD